MLKGKLETLDAIKEFIFAGKAIVTIKDIRDGREGKRLTFRIKQAQNKMDVFYVSTLTGHDNNEHYTYIGSIHNRNRFQYADGKNRKQSRLSPNALSVKWVSCFIPRLADGTLKLENIEIWHEGRCGRCGRLLTVPESIGNGFGAECLSIIEYQKERVAHGY